MSSRTSGEPPGSDVDQIIQTLYCTKWFCSSLVPTARGGQGGSWSGPDAVLHGGLALQCNSRCTFGRGPRRVTQFRLLLGCGFIVGGAFFFFHSPSENPLAARVLLC